MAFTILAESRTAMARTILLLLAAAQLSGAVPPTCVDPLATNYDTTCANCGTSCSAMNCLASTCTYQTLRDPYEPYSTWFSMSNYCSGTLGYSATVGGTAGLRRCYTEMMSMTPPFSRSYEPNARGVCNDNITNCVLPLTVQMNSLTVDQAVFDDRKGQIHVKVGYAIQHEDTRLLGLQLSDHKDVFMINPKLQVVYVGEEDGKNVPASTMHRTVDRESGTYYDPQRDETWVKSSTVHCTAVDACTVLSYSSVEQVHSISNKLYAAFPFDQHEFELDFTFTNPYQEAHSASKYQMLGMTMANNHLFSFDSDASTTADASLAYSFEHLRIHGYDFAYETSFLRGNKMNTAGVWRVKFTITRQYSKFMERFVLPLVFIVLVATSMTFLPSDKIGPRNQVCVIAMLTAVAFSNAASHEMPVTTQLTWYDQINIVSIIMPFLVIIENLVQHHVHQQDKKLGLKMDQVARVLFPFSYLTFVSASTYSTMIEIDTHKDTAAKYLAMLICVVIVGAFLGGRVIYQWVTTKDDEEAKPEKATDSSMEPRPVYLVGAPQPIMDGGAGPLVGIDLNNLTHTSPDPKTVAGETKEDASAFDFGSCMPSYGQEGLTHRTAGEGGGVAL